MAPQGLAEGDHMAYGRVETPQGVAQQQCRKLVCPSDQQTSVRTADYSLLLSWRPRFAAQVMDLMRIGKDGKASELRRTGRIWRKPVHNLERKSGSVKLENMVSVHLQAL